MIPTPPPATRPVARRWCARCETSTVEPTRFGFIRPDGGYGDCVGLGCPRCREFWTTPETPLVPVGYLDLEGLDPLTWFVGRLHALGCEPRPRR